MTGKARRVCLGAFAGAHGVKGDAKVKTFTAEPESVAAYGPVQTEDGGRTFTLRFIRMLKPGLALVSAPEIASREDAAALAGTRLYVDRDALPAPGDEDEFYMDDLVGLTAVDETGAEAGRVAAVHNFGAGDILELNGVPGVKQALMIPFTKEAVPGVDLGAGTIAVARAALDAAAGKESGEIILSDDTGEIVSDDLEATLAAMREEDA